MLNHPMHPIGIEYLVFLFFFSPGLFLDVTHAWVSVYLYGNGREDQPYSTVPGKLE
jgi:hypothetical protein